MTEEPKRKSRSMDEIKADIEAISQDPEHRDQFKALRMLAMEQSSSVTLPPPMENHEIIERIARVMKPFGQEISRISYKVAFPNAKTSIDAPAPTDATHLSEEDRLIVQHCRSIKSLYRHFPEVKRPGTPSGYPSKSGRDVQQKWCMDQATRILVGRQQARMKAIESRDVGFLSAADEEAVPGANAQG